LITAGSDISIRGTRVTCASQHIPGEYDQILIDGTDIENIRIDHCLIGDNDTLGGGLHARYGINAKSISDTIVGVFGPNTFGPNQNVNINKNAPIAGTLSKGDYVLTYADEDKASFVRCTTTGQPGSWMAGGIIGPNRIGKYQKTAADPFGLDVLDETVVNPSSGNDTIIKAEFIPNGSLISNDVDYATLTVYRYDANDTNQVIVAETFSVVRSWRVFRLSRIPHFTTLQKFTDRISNSLLEKIISSFIVISGTKHIFGIDSTGFKITHASQYYTGRTESRRKYAKLSIGADGSAAANT
jgi:hypothetical protein